MTKSFYKLNASRAEKNAWKFNKALTSENVVTLSVLISIEKLIQRRNEFKDKHQLAPSFTALIIKAVALTIKKHPEANRAILGLPFLKKLYQFTSTDISVAVEKSLPFLPGQPFVTPIRNPLEKSLQQITEELKALAVSEEHDNESFKLYMNILRYVPYPLSYMIINFPLWFPSFWSKYRGSACWVNSPSKAGADWLQTVWPWPMTFSFGVVKKRPLVVADKVEAQETMPLILVFDRRIMGGGPAGRTFATFAKILETADPELFKP